MTKFNSNQANSNNTGNTAQDVPSMAAVIEPTTTLPNAGNMGYTITNNTSHQTPDQSDQIEHIGDIYVPAE
jgi:hypothetical protein